MPWYRVNGMTVHVRGSKKLPPGCGESVGVQTSDGQAMMVCLTPSSFQCDWDIGAGRTCDRHLCEAHAHQVGKNKHYCPAHRLEDHEHRGQAGLFTELVEA
jgi:hypothetical protein